MPRNQSKDKDSEALTDPWLDLARQAYEASDTYLEANYRTTWTNDIRAFYNQHSLDSKYLSDAYRFRSKIYRPKTRATIRKNEAATAAAFFSNMDVINTEAENSDDPIQQASAEVYKALLQYRLTKTIPWFKVCIGAVQDAMTVGVVASYQNWRYQESPRTGKIIEDHPMIELMPVENLRIDPGASWVDPVKSSPYLIRMIPMYVVDVEAEMRRIDPKTDQPKWKPYPRETILQAAKSEWDSTRQARNKNRQDPHDVGHGKQDYELVWVHENFVRKGGEEYVYYSLATDHRLTEPKYLDEVYFHGERPIVIGSTIIETHKIYPSSIPELTREIQVEANEMANQRLDNVKLVLNKRYFAKRGRNVDTGSLTRNVPGAVTMMDDPDVDVRVVDTPDVTGSSYAEQDRINVDFDDLAGSFSTGTVQSNRKLNETVGGMQMLQGSANQMTEFSIRVFSESWVEPVMRQLVKLEQAYETDERVLTLVGEKAELRQKFGMDEVTEKMLMQDLTITVNVGVGATDPVMAVQRFLMAIRTLAEIVTNNPGINVGEAFKEVFGKLGYKDGKRFLMDQEQSPEVAQLMQQVQQLQQMLDTKQLENQSKEGIEKFKGETDLQKEAAKIQSAENIAQLEAETKRYIADRDNETRRLIAEMDNMAAQQLKAMEVQDNTQQRAIDRIKEDTKEEYE